MKILTLGVVLACALEAESQRGPEALVTAFYKDYLPRAHSGLLTHEELHHLRSFLSLGLFRLYDGAIEVQQEFMRNHPGEPPTDGGPPVNDKPPCVDGGDYFDGLSEWPDNLEWAPGADQTQRFEVTGDEALPDKTWRVHIRFWYDTTPVFERTQSLIIAKENGRFIIDDVVYSDDSGRLSSLLKRCAEE